MEREIQVKNVLTKSNLPVSDFSANPYVGCQHACKYCYASFMKRFTNHPEPWGEFLDVKNWPDIKNPEKYKDKEIFLSSVTDPYQPAEEKYRRTRKLLEQLKGSGCKISIATKSDLVLRDLDLIKTFPNARVSWSINTLDDKFQSQMDKGVPIERRIAAMKAFHDAGVRTTCFISPIFPGITKPVEIIKATRDFCDLVWLENLNLRVPYKYEILNFIRESYPELSKIYDDIYVRKDRSWWHELDTEISEFARKEGLKYVWNDDNHSQNTDKHPVIVNYFFHEELVENRNKKKDEAFK